MQSEESSTTGESLENLSYPGQHHANEVLNIGGQSADFDETAMGTDHHVHGLKRAVESDDEGEDGVLNDVDLKPKKKTRGRVKIEMKFITNKLRRYTTFSKRKTGIMKKAYELSTLTGTQVMLLVASETGHVYTFATRKLQPMITSESGKALIQTCLNSPDPPVSQIPNPDQRMSATGYEETDLTYTVGENDGEKDRGGIFTTQQIENNQGINIISGNGGSNVMTGITALSATGHSFPITTYIPPSSIQQGTKVGSAPSSYSVQAMPGGAFTTIFTPGTTFSGAPIQLGQPLPQGQQQGIQVLTQPLQIQRTQHQNQSVVTCVTASPAASTTHTTSTIPLVQETHMQETQEHTIDQGNNMQSIGTVVVPITNQDGTVSLGNVVPSMLTSTQSGQIPVMYSVYASPSSGLVTVANLPDGATDHTSGQQHHLSGEATEVTQQTLSNSLGLTTVQVQHDLPSNIQSYSQAVSTQTSDEVHNIVSDGTLTVGTETESELDKDGVPVPSNQTEV